MAASGSHRYFATFACPLRRTGTGTSNVTTHSEDASESTPKHP